jgi:hypothetical protein
MNKSKGMTNLMPSNWGTTTLMVSSVASIDGSMSMMSSETIMMASAVSNMTL